MGLSLGRADGRRVVVGLCQILIDRSVTVGSLEFGDGWFRQNGQMWHDLASFFLNIVNFNRARGEGRTVSENRHPKKQWQERLLYHVSTFLGPTGSCRGPKKATV